MLQERKANDMISEQLSYQEVYDKLNNWSEQTTASPSNVHLGHQRSLTQKYEVKDNQEILNDKQQQILQLRIDLINYAIKWNYTSSRWCNIVTLMIFKEQGNIKIH